MKIVNGIILTVVMMTGCVSTEVKNTVERNTMRVDKMVQAIDEGKTTRQQEQDFIRASRASFHSLNYYLNDVILPPDLQFLLGKTE